MTGANEDISPNTPTENLDNNPPQEETNSGTETTGDSESGNTPSGETNTETPPNNDESNPPPEVPEQKNVLTERPKNTRRSGMARTTATAALTEKLAPVEPTYATPADEVQTLFSNKFKISIDEAPPVIQIIRNTLNTYVQTMGESSIISRDQGAANQMKLFNTYMNALNADPTVAMMGLQLILYYFKAYRESHFNERLVFRYVDAFRTTKQNTANFNRLTTLFLATCIPSSRALGLKRVNLRMVADGLGENTTASNNLTMFYAR